VVYKDGSLFIITHRVSVIYDGTHITLISRTLEISNIVGKNKSLRQGNSERKVMSTLNSSAVSCLPVSQL